MCCTWRYASISWRPSGMRGSHSGIWVFPTLSNQFVNSLKISLKVHISPQLHFFFYNFLFTFKCFFFFYFAWLFYVPLFCRELMSQTRERRRRRVWGRRTPPRGRPIPRHTAVRSRKSPSNQLRTCRAHLTLSTRARWPSRHPVTYQTWRRNV